MTKPKWIRISIALTRRELEMLQIVKDWGGINSREMIQALIGVVWDDIPKKYKKKFIEKDEKEKKEQRKKMKRKIAEVKRQRKKRSHR